MERTQSMDRDGCPCGGTESALAASPRLFRNPVLDRLSRVHHFVPLILYAPAVAMLPWLGRSSLSGRAMFAELLSGYLIWTLVEYLGHRFLFHHVPRTAVGGRLQFLVHGVHHAHPSDPLRLVMPPLMSLPIMAGAFVGLRLAFGAPHVLPVMAGFVAGYVLYDMLHFHIHHRSPKTRLGKWLHFRHMHHHFRNDTSWFGVSAPWWDLVFGTRPARQSDRRERTRELRR